MKKECFVFTSDENKYGSIYKVLLNDIIYRDNVFYIEKTFIKKGRLFNFIKKILFSTIINIKTKEKCANTARRIYKNKYSLIRKVEQLQDEYETINIVMFNASIKRYYSAELLEDIKNKYKNVKLTLFFMDPSTIWASQNAMDIINNNPNIFDYIFTVDEDDAKQKQWIYWPTPYSKIEFTDCASKQDFYFCGATKDRHLLLIDLIDALNINNVKTKLDIFYIKKNEKNLDKLLEIINIKSIDDMKKYEDTLREVESSNCILELVTPDQSATYTLRDYEAVVYNKKLLTNNKSIFNFPYYNESTMKYFETIEDIDFEWIKKKTIVDYDYKGEYSPQKLIEEISRKNENK